MGKSKVTDYMIRYIEENRIDAKSLAAHAGIDAGKLRKDYKEPLDAEEFLSLCAYLHCPGAGAPPPSARTTPSAPSTSSFSRSAESVGMMPVSAAS